MTQPEIAVAIRKALATPNVYEKSLTIVLDRLGRQVFADLTGLLLIGTLGIEPAFEMLNDCGENRTAEAVWEKASQKFGIDVPLLEHLEQLNAGAGLSAEYIATMLADKDGIQLQKKRK